MYTVYKVIVILLLGMFMIDNVTGSVIVAKRLDREKESVITMTVTAKDQGKTSRSDTASVEVTLTDMNDNAPVIKPKKMTASVNEVRFSPVLGIDLHRLFLFL